MKSIGACLIFLAHIVGSFRVVNKRGATNSSKSCVELFVIGDFGDNDDKQKEVRDGMAKVAEDLNPEAILALGDNIYPDGAASESDMVHEWEDIWLIKSALQRDWYAVTGNHDWEEDANPMRNFKGSNGYWKMPHFWHQKKFGSDVEVFMIDTQIWRDEVDSMGESDIEEQKDWLENALQSSSAAWKIVAGHHPIYSAGSHGGSDTIHEEVDPMLRSNGATIYLSGHDHSQQHIHYNNVNYIVSGAGSKSPRSRKDDYPSGSLKRYQGETGFAGLSFCDTQTATLKLYDSGGSAKYTATLKNEAPSPPDSERRRRRRRRASAMSVSEVDGDLEIDAENELDQDAKRDAASSSRDEAACAGVSMLHVDLRCDDGCTVQPDVKSTDSCDDYCSSNGLVCIRAWFNEYEDCGLDNVTTCDSLVPSKSSQVCQCGSSEQ